MSAMQSSSSSVPLNAWGRVGDALTTRKSTSFLHVRLSRKSSVLFVTFAACSLFFVDKFLLDWLPGALYNLYRTISAGEDGGFFCYLVGFVSAYLCFAANRMMSLPASKRTSQKGHQMSSSRKSAAASKGMRTPSNKGTHSSAGGYSAQGNACKAAARSLPTPTKTAYTTPLMQLTNSLNQALSQGDARKALDVLTKLESMNHHSDADVYNQIMRAFAKSNDFDGAERILDRMCSRKLEPTEWSYSILMNMCAKADDVLGVEHWMSRMQRAGVVATWMTYSIVIHARARHGEETEAQEWMQKMIQAGHEPRCANYNSMIHACSVKRNVERAEEWLEEMRSKGIEPTVMTYTALVDACSKSLELKKAEKWMQQMLDLKIKPNVVSFSTMIDACARVGDLARAELWYSKMMAQEVKPNAFIFSALINACAKANDPPAACDWLSRAEASRAVLDAVVYGCVINACGKAGDSKRAMMVFRQMREQGIRTHIIVYGALARPFAYEGDWQSVERLAEEMESDGIQMNDYFLYTMLLAYSRAKPRRGDKAEKAFCDAMSRGLKVNDRILKALSSAVGRARAAQLAEMAQGVKN